MTVAAGLIIKHLLDRRKLNSSDLKYIVELQAKDNAEQKADIKVLEEKYESLSRRFDFLESAKFQSSIPQWFKDHKSRLIYGNKAYIDQFLTPNGIEYENAIDRDDSELYPENGLGLMYMANDRQVMRTGVGTFFEGEMMVGGHPVKYRAYVDPVTIKGQITGVAGMAVPMG